MAKLKLIKASQIFQLTALATALALAGCGGGGGSSSKPIDVIAPTPGTGGGSTPVNGNDNGDTPAVGVGKVILVSPPSFIQMTQGSTATVKVRIVDDNNGILSGQTVVFTVPDSESTGVVNTNTSSVVTDENGEATITLEIPSKLTDAQKEYLKDTGVAVTAATSTDSKTFTIKGSEEAVVVDSNYIVHIVNSVSTMNTGSDETAIVFRVLDDKGGIQPGVPVSFELQPDPEAVQDYGVSFGSASTLVTDDKGQVSISLVQNRTGLDAQLDHTVTLIAKINDVQEQSVIVDITGTTVRAVSTTLDSSANGTNDLVNIEGILVDGSGSAIKNAEVALYNGDIEAATVKTSSDGKFSFTDVSLTNLTTTMQDGKEVYVFDLNVKGKTLEQRLTEVATVTKVTSESIEISECIDAIVGQSCTITVNAPSQFNGKTVRVVTTKGQFSNGSNTAEATISGGKATFTIISNSPGTTTLTAEVIGENESSSKPMSFLSIDPATLIIQATKVELPTNSTTEISARVLDENDAPVQNAWVQFTVVKDSSGGNIETGLVKTNEAGIATTTYSSGGNPTQSGGVQIRAQLHSVELNSGELLKDKIGDVAPAIVNLTVQTAASTITSGLADKLSTGDGNDVYYFRDGSITVTNNGGQPSANQVVTIKLLPYKYYKGFWIYDYRIWEENGITFATQGKEWHIPQPYIQNPKYQSGTFAPDYLCENEDKNFNSILDEGEDFNSDGFLNPGFRATVLVDGQVVSGNNGTYTLTTDSEGRVDFQIRYFKQYAQWMRMKMVVATSVDGTEASQERIVDFPVLAGDVTAGSSATRPNVESPFGTNECSVAQ